MKNYKTVSRVAHDRGSSVEHPNARARVRLAGLAAQLDSALHTHTEGTRHRQVQRLRGQSQPRDTLHQTIRSAPVAMRITTECLYIQMISISLSLSLPLSIFLFFFSTFLYEFIYLLTFLSLCVCVFVWMWIDHLI